jgi:hypothetical protein
MGARIFFEAPFGSTGITGSAPVLSITLTAHPVATLSDSPERLCSAEVLPGCEHQAIFRAQAVPLGPVALSCRAAGGYIWP